MLLSEGNSCWLLWFGPNVFSVFLLFFFYTMLIFQLTLFAKEDTEHFLSCSGGRLLKRIYSDSQIVLYLVQSIVTILWHLRLWLFVTGPAALSLLQHPHPAAIGQLPWKCKSAPGSCWINWWVTQEINMRGHMLGSVQLRCQHKFTNTYMGWIQTETLWM